MITPQLFQFLMETDYFQGVSREHVQGLCEAFQIAYLPADEVIFRTGDDGDAWYLVISGAVRIAGNRADGSPLEFAVVEPGDGFGEIALLDEGLRSADAITTSPTSLARLPPSGVPGAAHRRSAGCGCDAEGDLGAPVGAAAGAELDHPELLHRVLWQPQPARNPDLPQVHADGALR